MKVYFDLDGTLIDSSKRHTALLQRILCNRNINFDKDVIDKYVQYKRDGINTENYLRNIVGLGKSDAREISQIWIENIEKDEYLDMDVLYPETINVLEYLKRRKIPIDFISARTNYNGVISELVRLNIDMFPDNIYIVNPSKASENKYTCLKSIVNTFDIIVGDTEVDYNLALKLNVKYIILNRGFRSKRFWDNQGIKSYEEILDELRKVVSHSYG